MRLHCVHAEVAQMRQQRRSNNGNSAYIKVVRCSGDACGILSLHNMARDCRSRHNRAVQSEVTMCAPRHLGNSILDLKCTLCLKSAPAAPAMVQHFLCTDLCAAVGHADVMSSLEGRLRKMTLDFRFDEL